MYLDTIGQGREVAQVTDRPDLAIGADMVTAYQVV
jgi:hypothetical protein